MSSSQPANRLASAASAYLRQHAHNPVDWYPWGDEALAKARDEDRPIMLSIGYSACHWCHVMERESFEDAATALLLNTRFVCIKVDREERPDLDHVYQTVVQLMGRSGGWPLTVFLTPDQRPFFAGTYFPPEKRYGMPAFRDVLIAVHEAYVDRRDEVVAQAAELVSAIAEVNQPSGSTDLDREVLKHVEPKLIARFDTRFGGFGSAPKFPNTMSIEVLLRTASIKTSDAVQRARVRLALDGMRRGGIWDQLGGGFHRYSTDERWLVPHFEKMLYDNALLLRLYLDAGRAFDEPAYIDVASDIAAYLLREMKSPGGAFYATQDADSEGVEGKFFVWTPDELAQVVDDPIAREAATLRFGITREGNFEHEGATVLSLVESFDAIATRTGEPVEVIRAAFEKARQQMFTARETRPKPFRDEKILAGWNGLLLGALAELGAHTENATLIDAAESALAHIERALITNGRVARFTTDDGFVARPGFLEDHASIANAALDLYEVTGKARYAVIAREIADEIIAKYADPAGGFFISASDGESLICRIKDAHDSATPSGSSLAARVMLRLGAMLGEKYTQVGRQALEAVARGAIDGPMGFGQTLLEIDRLARGSIDIVIVGPAGHPTTLALRKAALSRYVPNRTLVSVDPSDPSSIEVARELAEGKPAGRDGSPVAYVCRDHTCSAPVSSPEALIALIT